MKQPFLQKELFSSLSPLECEVLKIFSQGREFRAKDIFLKICKKRKVALSSIPVILDRLHTKGLVARRAETCRGGVRYIYSLQKNRMQFEKYLTESAVNRLIEKFGQNALSYFNERFPEKTKVK